MSQHDDVLRIVAGLPEHRLRLIELARDMVKEDGSIDPDQALLHVDEIETAKHEAIAYGNSTKQAIWVLKELLHSAP